MAPEEMRDRADSFSLAFDQFTGGMWRALD
jgi:hypothetical protein